MEVQVAEGSWTDDMILQVRVGDVKRDAALRQDARVCFPKMLPGPQQLQVDIFRRVGTRTFTVQPQNPTMNLTVEGEGLAGLGLRVTHQLEDLENPGLEGSGLPSEERLQKLRQGAARYIERWDLRQVLQDLFQTVIRERPDEPFEFMARYLTSSASSPIDKGTEAKASSLAKPTQELTELRELLEKERRKTQRLQEDLANKGDYATTTTNPMGGPDFQAAAEHSDPDLQRRTQQRLDEQSTELEQRRLQDLKKLEEQLSAAFAAERSSLELAFEEQLEKQKAYTAEVEHRIKELQASKGPSEKYINEIELLKAQNEGYQRQIQTLQAAAQGQNGAPGGDSAAGGAPSSAGAQARELTPLVPPAHALLSQANVNAEVNTHMLSQLLAATYAAPMQSSLFSQPTEEASDPQGEIDVPPEVLVSVTNCRDLASNGTYAWVGEYNARPLYRLLGAEPRYLYYGGVDIAACWRLVDKTTAAATINSNNSNTDRFVDRFLEQSGSLLPTNCPRGECGAEIRPQKLSQALVGKISLVANLEEKVTIRNKLGECCGAEFAKMEGAQRGLTSKASPVLAVARTMEAQQRAIQLLHQQLAAEALRREAAESHAQTMEEAFETLQLRIHAQLPGPPAVADLKKQVRDLQSDLQPIRTPSPVGPPQSQDRELIFRKNGDAAWGPDIGPGQGPMARPPLSPKERRPVTPPTFSRLPSSLRPRPPSAPKPVPA